MEVIWLLRSPPGWRPSSGQHQPADEAGLGAGPGGGQAGRTALEHLPDADAHHTTDAEDLGMSLAQIALGQGVSESLVWRVLKVEDVEALPATAFKDGWD